MSISEKLTQLAQIKEDIKQAIIDKGQEATDDMTQYSTLIGNISGGGGSDEDFAAVISGTAVSPTIPSGVTAIKDYCFYKDTKIINPVLPAGITSIGQYAFSGCTNLALTSFPSSLTSIGASAFAGCTGLTEITFKMKPTTLNSTAFSGCTNLTSIKVPWSQGAVSGAPWGATNATITYDYTE